jgi:WD40 repeat protein
MADAPKPLIDSLGVRLACGEEIIALAFAGDALLIAAGDASVTGLARDGAVAWRRADVHAGALLCASVGPGGDFFTGGDDGAVQRINAAGEVAAFARVKGWVDDLAASKKRVAVACGKQALVYDGDGEKRAAFDHPVRVAGLAFDPDGRRIACAHLDGATIWFAANPDSRGKTLTWKGAHLIVGWSPDGKFVLTGMQENALHGWRLQDGSHFRMSGYPAKIRNLSFTFDAKQCATSGAPEIVLWPFDKPTGPVNQAANVVGQMGAPCTRVACHPTRPILAAGDAAGEVAVQAVSGQGRPILVSAAHDAPITALVWSRDGARLAFGDANGGAGMVDFSSVMAG